MSHDHIYGEKPKRTLIAYCALAERLNKPHANMLQALIPFFAEACKDFAGQMFDASRFSEAVRKNFGIEIPKLAALGIAEQLAGEGILEITSGYANSTTYRYVNTAWNDRDDVSSVTENDVEAILRLFTDYCKTSTDLTESQTNDLNADFLERLLNIDSMRLLSRRESSITTKQSSSTLQLTKNESTQSEAARHSLQLDFLVSSFILHLRETDLASFETVSNIAFANMAAEAIACFREPQTDEGDLSGLTVLLDTPLVLDMLSVNTEYTEYGKDLLNLLKESGCNISILDHSITEAENTVGAKLNYLRSGVNQLTSGFSARPNLLAALSGNIAERVESRLGIKIKKDPEINLHRRSQNTVGDIEAAMTARMAAWRNEDAKSHDRATVWALISLRDSTNLQTRICKSDWILLTRNTPLLKICNDAWKTWLKGSTKHSQTNIERCAPVSMTDKQFAGYIWARSGGGRSTIPKSLLLAHCSAAVRPRADIKAKAYNLMLEMHGQEEAQDLIALFEDREGSRALMKATLGDPEDVTPQRMALIIEKVKMAAGEFATSHVREAAQNELALVNTQNLERISKIQESANENLERALAEKEKIALEKFEQNLRASQLETEARNLKNELQKKEEEFLIKRNVILERGFIAAKREYWATRWLLVILFGLITSLISANTFEFSTTLTALFLPVLTIAGYWFVPEFLEPIPKYMANRRFASFVKHLDSSIDYSQVSIDYINSNYSIHL